MSLFKTRQFWSLDLEQLEGQLNGGARAVEGANKLGASFLFDLGQFHSVGRHQVLACASLRGLLCLIQCPHSRQPQLAGESKQAYLEGQDGDLKTEEEEEEEQSLLARERQLLAAKELGLPIADLKCGYFNSALKQSIAVLSFNKLILLRPKRHQIDLLACDQLSRELSGFDENLLSHEFEELYRIELLAPEIATGLVVLDCHASSKLADATDPAQAPTGRANRSGERQQQFRLPQRDTIVVQYTNQLLLTMVDQKKVVGHFKLTARGQDGADQSADVSKVQELVQFVGRMPMAFLCESGRSHSLVVSQSDHKIYSLPLTTLIARAKQGVIGRVARNLLLKDTKQSSISNQTAKPASDDDLQRRIDIDLVTCASWCFELAASPIRMSSLRRRLKSSSSSVSLQSQLLVMSRYNLDLISSSGQHLWSQRFEAPMVCMEPYLIESASGENDSNSALNRANEEQRLLTLACNESQLNGRCNLLVFEEDNLVWSALLECKPFQIKRANLSKVTGALVALDSNESQLYFSFLGTNVESDDGELDDCEGSATEFAQFEQLDEPLNEDGNADFISSTANSDSGGRKLLVDVRLEASNQWPNVMVDCRVSIKPANKTSGALKDMVAVLEFDDLISFKTLKPDATQVSVLSDGVVQIQLGDCWSDRREPLLLEGQFTLQSTNCADAIKGKNAKQQVFGHSNNLAPKSLKVNIYIRFNQLNFGCSMQEESFLLPLNMLARLVHIDYSSGQSQRLADVQTNLVQYRRQPPGYLDEDGSSKADPPYYLCDMSLRLESDLIGVIDEIIESDLICRGLNSMSASNNAPRRKESTLEIVNLLAQSLDCRLKYKSSTHPTSLVRQSSEDCSPAVMVSVAITMSAGTNVMEGDSLDLEESSADYTVVWLHFCDLIADDSIIIGELVQQHMGEWKALDVKSQNFPDTNEAKMLHPILMSIESTHPLPMLFLQDHLIERLRGSHSKCATSSVGLKLRPLCNSDIHMIQERFVDFFKTNDFIAISVNLHDRLKSALESYEKNVRDKFIQLKQELDREYCKFYASTMTSLSISKRLFNLPDEMQQQFKYLNRLTNYHQLNLVRLLGQLGDLKSICIRYGKVPNSRDILIEHVIGNDALHRHVNFEQFV